MPEEQFFDQYNQRNVFSRKGRIAGHVELVSGIRTAAQYLVLARQGGYFVDGYLRGGDLSHEWSFADGSYVVSTVSYGYTHLQARGPFDEESRQYWWRRMSSERNILYGMHGPERIEGDLPLPPLSQFNVIVGTQAPTRFEDFTFRTGLLEFVTQRTWFRITTTASPIVMHHPASISGRINGLDSNGLSYILVALPAFGLVVSPNSNGSYLLQGVPPGLRQIELLISLPLINFEGIRQEVNIRPGEIHTGIDFDASALVPYIPRPSSAAIAGRVIGLDMVDLASVVISIPELGLLTRPDSLGGYLIQGVPPGRHRVHLLSPLSAGLIGRVHSIEVNVEPHSVRLGVDFRVEEPPLIDTGTIVVDR